MRYSFLSKRLSVLMVPIFCLTLAGCGSFIPQPREVSWIIIPAENTETTADVGQTTGKKHHISVGPVTVPSYLKRSDLFTVSADNKGTYNESVMWAEHLEDAVERVLTIDLGTILPVKSYVVNPMKSQIPAEKHIFINVERFEGGLNKTLQFAATWSVLDQTGDTISSGHYTDSEKVSSEIPDLVKAHGTVLQRFARHLAKYLR